ncbi:hypothetical protein ACK3SF_02790 [Candidatus Nanosalina sp. VS9-1]|uniref:hypothetical protein n=1 Tax=Candidatus Nanosalina sp. VS9-1 TaxID=3388566 RepID=UPI0039E1D921
MGLQDYHWTQKDLRHTEYAGKYVTHSRVNRNSVVEQLTHEEVDLELGEHTLEYEGEKMNVRLDVNTRWASFMYDEKFEQQLGEENFEDVILHFITPDEYKFHTALDGA